MIKYSHQFILGLVLLFICCTSDVSWAQERYGVYVSDLNSLTQILNNAKTELGKDPTNTTALKKAGIASHQLALFHGKGYAEQSVEYLSKVTEQDRNDAVALAYLGSAHALVARDASVIMTKISNVNKGLSLLNRAIRTAPENFIVRMVRGSVIFELPSMFKKTDHAIEDFSVAERHFDNLPDIPDVPVDLMKAEVYYKLGSLKKEVGDKAAAVSYFQKAMAAAPDSQWAQRAKKE